MASSLTLMITLLLTFLSSSLSDNVKEAKLHFFFHDVVVGTSPTAIRIAQAPATQISLTGFGALVMIDDPLTEDPDPNSKLVGYAQGMYALASKEEAGLMMVMNLAFVDGEFNGSTLAVLGRNTVFSEVREMPVIGGTGKFKFARGFVQAKTHEFDLITGNAIVEYDVQVRYE